MWRSTLSLGTWWPKRLRRMGYEKKDSPITIPNVPLSLPDSIVPPNQRIQPT